MTSAAPRFAMPPPIGLRVFSATRARDREVLGETITQWITAHPEYDLLECKVLQSSDSEFHCLSIVIFFRPREVQ